MGLSGDPPFRERVPIFPVEWGPGSPFHRENRDPHPHIPGRKGMGVPDFGGPVVLLVPVVLLGSSGSAGSACSTDSSARYVSSI